jgi:nanoRNase/pAp phosphatase (c-di-AMP/oligoRNAs hydrolase)
MSSVQKLRDLLAEETELTIVCHNDPDPDCLASATPSYRRPTTLRRSKA